jgi:hypothetical protein
MSEHCKRVRLFQVIINNPYLEMAVCFLLVMTFRANFHTS